LIGVITVAIHTIILYFTMSMDKPMLNQIYIAGGHLGVVVVAPAMMAVMRGGGGGWERQGGRRWRQQQQQQQAWHQRRGGSMQGDQLLPLAITYLLCEKQCSAKVLCIEYT
jgi:hypothetical protein